MSMERFWYLLVAFQTTEFAKSVLKLSFHEPRPTWMWPDVLPIGCSSSFGLPSGHCSESANFVLILLLDQFKPSNWSRANHPNLNSKTVTNSPYAFAAVIALFFTYWPLVVFDRVVLGKHTLNQALTGSLVGFWCALFAHFCLRDSIFYHVNKLTNGKMRITADEAFKYTKTAVLIFLTMLTTAVVVSYINANRAIIKQTWLINLTNTCGMNFETDTEGNYIVYNMFAQFFGDAIPPTAALAGPLGLYLGMLTFRYNGCGRLGKKAFSSRNGIEQILYAACIYAIMAIPEKSNSTLYKYQTMNVWGYATLQEAVP